MGLFNFKSSREPRVREISGYKIGVDNNIIYHVPIGLKKYILPNGTTGISEDAILEIVRSGVEEIVFPASFRSVRVNLSSSATLRRVKYAEGIEEALCNVKPGTVDFELPSTIKKIGKDNYPATQHLKIPEGVEELSVLLASHNTYLISAEIPGTVKHIPSGCFNQCSNIQSIILHDGVESVEIDSFRGTNNLKTLRIPSTLNGRFSLSMNARPIAGKYGAEGYTAANLEIEEASSMSLFIKRGNKDFEIVVRRGSEPTINLSANEIDVIENGFSPVTIDATTMEAGTYYISNGTFKKKGIVQNNGSSSNTSPAKKDESVINAFEVAFDEFIAPIDEFRNLPENIRTKIKRYMQDMALDSYRKSNKIIVGYDGINWLYNKSIKELDFESLIEQYSRSTSPAKNDDHVKVAFELAFEENIIGRNDFINLPESIKSRIKQQMQALFLDTYRRIGKINDDFSSFDNFFKKSINILGLRDTVDYYDKPMQSGGMKK